MTPKSPLQAIKTKCLECCGCVDIDNDRASIRSEAKQSVQGCTSTWCPLHPFRDGHNPFHGQEPHKNRDIAVYGTKDSKKPYILNKKVPLDAIVMKCFDCGCYNPDNPQFIKAGMNDDDFREAQHCRLNCQIEGCALHPFRLRKNPRQKNLNSPTPQ